MEDYLIFLVGICFILCSSGLEPIKSLKETDLKAITLIGWALYILKIKGGF